MQLRLRTKLTLVMTGLVLLVVVVLSGVFVAQLLSQVLEQTDKRTHEIAHQVFEQAQRALTDAANEGLRPISNSPEDIHQYVWQAFKIDEGLRSQMRADKDTIYIYEVAITDRDGMVLISTDESTQGKFLPHRAPLSQLTQRGFLHQVRVLAGLPKIYELTFPFSKGGQPFGEVRVAFRPASCSTIFCRLSNKSARSFSLRSLSRRDSPQSSAVRRSLLCAEFPISWTASPPDSSTCPLPK